MHHTDKFSRNLAATFVSWPNIRDISDQLVEPCVDIDFKVREFSGVILAGRYNCIKHYGIKYALEAANEDFLASLVPKTTRILEDWKNMGPARMTTVVNDEEYDDVGAPNWKSRPDAKSTFARDVALEGMSRFNDGVSSGVDWTLIGRGRSIGRPIGNSYYRSRRIEQEQMPAPMREARELETARRGISGNRFSRIVKAATSRLDCCTYNEN